MRARNSINYSITGAQLHGHHSSHHCRMPMHTATATDIVCVNRSAPPSLRNGPAAKESNRLKCLRSGAIDGKRAPQSTARATTHGTPNKRSAANTSTAPQPPPPWILTLLGRHLAAETTTTTTGDSGVIAARRAACGVRVHYIGLESCGEIKIPCKRVCVHVHVR